MLFIVNICRGFGGRTTTMTTPTLSRRAVLRSGAAVSGGMLTGGSVVGSASAQERGPTVASSVESHGHYAWFPLGPDSWGRSSEPYDLRSGDARWMAQPDSEGGIRCLAANLATEPPNRNAGFDVHLGRLGEVESLTIRPRTVQTPRTTGPSSLFVGLYFDADGNGDFFEWESGDGADRWVGLGGDEEAVSSFGASGVVTIDGETTFSLVAAETQATLDELRTGAI